MYVPKYVCICILIQGGSIDDPGADGRTCGALLCLRRHHGLCVCVCLSTMVSLSLSFSLYREKERDHGTVCMSVSVCDTDMHTHRHGNTRAHARIHTLAQQPFH
jgi:hypothetical protein